jgi:hypothetical protein
MVDRRGLHKKRAKMEKRDERKETGRQQKRGYKQYAKERASGRLRTEYMRANHGSKMEEVSNSLRPFYFLQHPSIYRPHTEDQRTNMDMKKK